MNESKSLLRVRKEISKRNLRVINDQCDGQSKNKNFIFMITKA